jgi:hypothetical protein
MNATRTSARRLTATVILLALAGSADSVAEGTTKIVQVSTRSPKASARPWPRARRRWSSA